MLETSYIEPSSAIVKTLYMHLHIYTYNYVCVTMYLYMYIYICIFVSVYTYIDPMHCHVHGVLTLAHGTKFMKPFISPGSATA